MEDIMYAESRYMQVPINEKTVTTELSGDFSLPDYQPEIKRLLRVSASVLPPTKYVGDSESELSGGIDYYVLYTGSDNQVYCAPLSSEYKVIVPMDKNELALANMTSDADIVPESVTGRVTSPRKLNIKCRLRTRARMYGDAQIDSSYASLGGENQVLLGRDDITKRIFAQSDMVHLSDEMIQPGGADEIRVINAQGSVMISEKSTFKDAVNCKGEVYLKLLMCREGDGVPYAVTRRLPFNTSIGAEGADGDCESGVKGSVCEMNINVEEGHIGIDVGIMLEASVCKKEEIKYVKDIYSTARKTECSYLDIPVLKEGRVFNANFTQSDSMTIEEAGISPEHKIIDVIGCAYPDTATLEGDRWVFTGKSKFSLLLEKEGEYSVCEIEMPYRYSAESSNGENAFASGSAEVISARARLDGERVGVDAEIMMRCITSDTANIRMLDNVSYGDAHERSGGDCIVCYPSSSDTVWDVAKKYSTTVSALIENNKIGGGDMPDANTVLAGIKYLIV